jgi:hypothetical protein
MRTTFVIGLLVIAFIAVFMMRPSRSVYYKVQPVWWEPTRFWSESGGGTDMRGEHRHRGGNGGGHRGGHH